MPTSTYIPLANLTLGSSASSVTFSSIPATYRDLVLVVNATLPSEGVPRVRLNGDSGTNYSYVTMLGSSSGAQSFNASTDTFVRLGQTGTGFSGNQFIGIAQFMDYSATDKHTTVLIRNGDDSVRAVAATANRWANTAAVNQIEVFASANTFAAGSTFNLFGIAS